MGLAQTRMTASKFLVWEQTQADRHQFFESEVYAMADGTAEHNLCTGAAFDRGIKFAAYRQIACLEEYLLLDQEVKTAKLFRKNAAGIWESHPSDAANPRVKLNSVEWVGDNGGLFE